MSFKNDIKLRVSNYKINKKIIEVFKMKQKYKFEWKYID